MGKEVGGHLDERVGAGILVWSGGGQAVAAMLDHNQGYGYARGMQLCRQFLRVMGRDEPVIGTMHDQERWIVGPDIGEGVAAFKVALEPPPVRAAIHEGEPLKLVRSTGPHISTTACTWLD